jgi:hypothetical protein
MSFLKAWRGCQRVWLAGVNVIPRPPIKLEYTSKGPEPGGHAQQRSDGEALRERHSRWGGNRRHGNATPRDRAVRDRPRFNFPGQPGLQVERLIPVYRKTYKSINLSIDNIHAWLDCELTVLLWLFVGRSVLLLSPSVNQPHFGYQHKGATNIQSRTLAW